MKKSSFFPEGESPPSKIENLRLGDCCSAGWLSGVALLVATGVFWVGAPDLGAGGPAGSRGQGTRRPLAEFKGAEDIPAFARKYDLSCNACHTREPRLNAFGQRFQENGYQLPGTEDGGTAGKSLLGTPRGGATLDAVTNFLAVRLRGEARQAFTREGRVSEEVDLATFPNVVNFYFAGTPTEDVSFFLETEFAPRSGHGESVRFERAMLTLNNLGGHQLANLRVGNFDPSGFYSFPTHRQQFNTIFGEAHGEEFPPEIRRVPVVPLAFTAKMYGLTRGPSQEGGDEFSVLPFEPVLFNSPAETGATVYGRPFGRHLLYQAGVVQGETAEDDPELRHDLYGMLRLDFMPADYLAVQASGFVYQANDAVRPTLGAGSAPPREARAPGSEGGALTARAGASSSGVGSELVFGQPVDWTRWGLGARLQYRYFDLYGTVVWDRIGGPSFADPEASESTWDREAVGVSVEGDWVVSQDWMLGLRWDHMAPGGLTRLPPELQEGDPAVNQDASFLGPIAKFYPVPNVGLYARSHVNLLGDVSMPEALGGGSHPARDLQWISTIGVDMAF